MLVGINESLNYLIELEKSDIVRIVNEKNSAKLTGFYLRP